MKARLTAVCVLLLSLCGPVSALEWTPFSNPKANFRAVFPAQPQESVQSIETELGPIPYTTFMSEIDNGNIAFGVAYNDYPVAVQKADPQVVLDGGRDGAVENLKGTLVSETRLTFKGHPGREFTILGEVQGKKLFYHTRIFLVEARLYQLQIVRVGDTPIDVADAVRFFSSFEQIKE